MATASCQTNFTFTYLCMPLVILTTPAIGSHQALRSDRRLIVAVLLSILVHALVLSLQFGVPGLGLPGMELPWHERRAELELIRLQLQIAAPQEAQMVAPVPSPLPMTSAPVPKEDATVLRTPPISTTTNSGMQMLTPAAIRIPALAPPVTSPVIRKKRNPRSQETKPPVHPVSSASPVPVIPVPPKVIENPVRVIAQDRYRDDNFVVPMPSPEEPERPVAVDSLVQSVENTHLQPELQSEKPVENKEQEKLTESVLQTERAEIRAGKALEEQRARDAKLMEQQRELQEKNDLLLAQRELDEKLAAKKMAEQRLEQAQSQDRQLQRQQAAVLEATRLEQFRQRELQATERRMAVDLERRQQVESQEKQQIKRQAQLEATIRQKQLDALAEKQKAEELQALKKAQELQAQKLAEQKLAEQKLAEQKIAEQIQAEQRLVQQKEAAQRETERQNLLNAAAASQRVAAGTDASRGSAELSGDVFSSGLASPAKDPLRGIDLLRGTPPVPVKTRAEQDERSRRRSIFGSIEREIPLRMYVDSWRQKIERNGNLNYSQLAKDKARGDPVVLVALRSNGSVEEVTIIRSSGRADLDEAVRRIIRFNAPYAAFPPNIAATYDVIEIRRVWNFDETLKILEEMR
jgi:TonB family protein